MTTYWTYKRDGDPLKLDVITAGGVDFCSRSFYAGKPIRGNVLELSDAQLQTVIEEVGKRVIVNHAQVANAKSVIVGGIADGGEPLGRHLTLLPLQFATEHGYLLPGTPEPTETMAGDVVTA